MNEKPWDKLRQIVEPKPPILSGVWRTDHSKANVHVLMYGGNSAILSIRCGDKQLDCFRTDESQQFRSGDLRQLAEFCVELANQLDK